MNNNAQRAAVNTTINYIQLGMNVIISLLTIRFVLKSLGEIDYGIYSLIAGVITLISFVSESLSQTSIRFISVSLGSDGGQQVPKVFSTCFSLHLYMAIIMTVILEVTGIFLFDGFLNIPDQRLFAARIVYHCMVATLFASILSTPFRAIFIANEKFSYIAIIGILESILKLLVAICILFSSLDRLILYGVLMSFVGFAVLFCFVVLSQKKFSGHVSLQLVGIRKTKQIAQFAGWTLLDVFGTIANRQGYAIMLNKFYGPSTNAIFALAQHVESPLFSMSASAISSIRPQILKSYGEGNINRALRLSYFAGKLGFSLMALLAIPIFVMLPDVLSLWLGEYPLETVFFARMMIIASLMNQLSLGLATVNQALGKIKWFSIVVSSIRMSALPISIIMLSMGVSARVTMIIYMICESLASVSRVVVMRFIAGIEIRPFVTDVILRIIPAVVFSGLFCLLIYSFSNCIWLMLANAILTALIYSLSLYCIGLTEPEKRSINDVANRLISRLRRN